jgi:large exoprotein involved in heme utilization and adhesion
LNYRDHLTSENDITASSEFGINGNVQVNNIGINPTNTLNILPVDIVDSSTQISDRCASSQGSSFIATGRGGMPQSPIKQRRTDRSWHDLRSTVTLGNSIVQPIQVFKYSSSIVEASAFQIDALGAIALVAPNPIGFPAVTTCGVGESR